jgi:hypothetical protein
MYVSRDWLGMAVMCVMEAVDRGFVLKPFCKGGIVR